MFTGLVQRTGEIVQLRPAEAGGVRLTVRSRAFDLTPSPGDSICVSGCCLTLVGEARSTGEQIEMDFDVIEESLAKTKLGGLAEGSRVNLETSCTPATLLGGHVVQGHVEGVGEVVRIESGESYEVTIRPPEKLMPCITPKGSITLDGISLTIAGVDVSGGTFHVALIPTTLGETTIGDAKVGEGMNIETDIMARTVVHYLQNYSPGGS
ncbi:MAG: riboflavin synthase [Phycisphaera sp.]|nr:MAG: riboflavin synthase [Phycisphaera sp.]